MRYPEKIEVRFSRKFSVEEWGKRQEQILKIGNTELYLKRECDWENADRRATIVYAGYSGSKTYRDKKAI